MGDKRWDFKQIVKEEGKKKSTQGLKLGERFGVKNRGIKNKLLHFALWSHVNSTPFPFTKVSVKAVLPTFTF